MNAANTGLAIVLTLALGACGGAAEEGEHHELQGGHHEGGEHVDMHEGEGHEGEQHEGEEHGTLPAEVEAFHSLMAPIWHAEEGASRGSLACESATRFAEHAAAVQGAEVPEAAQDTTEEWSAATANLVATAAALTTECGTEAQAEAEAKLSDIHDAFHGIVDLLRAE